MKKYMLTFKFCNEVRTSLWSNRRLALAMARRYVQSDLCSWANVTEVFDA